MIKAEKIYAGFYACGEYSIERKFDDSWYIFDKMNKLINARNTLQSAVEYVNKLVQ